MTKTNQKTALRIHSALLDALNARCPEDFVKEQYETSNNALAVVIADYVAETFGRRHMVAGLGTLRDVLADAARNLEHRS